MKKKTVHQYYTARRRAFYAGISLVCVLGGTYMYLLSASVAHVVLRKELSQEIAEMHARISTLEAEYIIAKNAVVEDMAFARGFERRDEKIFVMKTPPSLVFSSGNERR